MRVRTLLTAGVCAAITLSGAPAIAQTPDDDPIVVTGKRYHDNWPDSFGGGFGYEWSVPELLADSGGGGPLSLDPTPPTDPPTLCMERLLEAPPLDKVHWYTNMDNYLRDVNVASPWVENEHRTRYTVDMEVRLDGVDYFPTVSAVVDRDQVTFEGNEEAVDLGLVDALTEIAANPVYLPHCPGGF